MNKKRIIRIGLILTTVGISVGIGIGVYMFNAPHLDVQAQEVDFKLTSSELVDEYLADSKAANLKYLNENGNSKILEISGLVSKITEDYSGQKVILLKAQEANAGVSATFPSEINAKVAELEIGDLITIKGVIRSGANYDEDLELYEHVVLDKSDIVSN